MDIEPKNSPAFVLTEKQKMENEEGIETSVVTSTFPKENDHVQECNGLLGVNQSKEVKPRVSILKEFDPLYSSPIQKKLSRRADDEENVETFGTPLTSPQKSISNTTQIISSQEATFEGSVNLLQEQTYESDIILNSARNITESQITDSVSSNGISVAADLRSDIFLDTEPFPNSDPVPSPEETVPPDTESCIVNDTLPPITHVSVDLSIGSDPADPVASNSPSPISQVISPNSTSSTENSEEFEKESSNTESPESHSPRVKVVDHLDSTEPSSNEVQIEEIHSTSLIHSPSHSTSINPKTASSDNCLPVIIVNSFIQDEEASGDNESMPIIEERASISSPKCESEINIISVVDNNHESELENTKSTEQPIPTSDIALTSNEKEVVKSSDSVVTCEELITINSAVGVFPIKESVNSPALTVSCTDIEIIKSKMTDLSEDLAKQQQENSELRLQLNAMQQARASLELEVRQKEEIIIKSQAEALKAEQKFKQEIKLLKEKVKENSALIEEGGTKHLQDQLKEAQLKEAKSTADLQARLKTEEQHAKVMEEYDRALQLRLYENEKLKEKFEINKTHLANLELAFSDVHSKYEKSKESLQASLLNEEALIVKLDLAQATNIQHEERYESLRQHARNQIDKSNKELLAQRERYEMEVLKLKAIIKRLEIKCSSLEISIQQKTEECEQLSALCEEVTGKKI